MPNKLLDNKNFFEKLKNGAWFGRLGKTFNTENNYYYLDTGTGKIAQINENVYKVLNCLFENNNFDSLLELNLGNSELALALDEIIVAVKNENILSAPILETLTGEPVLNLKDMLDNSISNITLELTQKCNLRCKYCIYNSFQKHHREFGHKDMSFETAKKAIDFLVEHSNESKEIYVGFYGGEPLLNFDLLKKSIDYVKTKNKNIAYALTTNATLITEDMADYLVKNKVTITISLDGPESIHNKNRIYENGKGSFNDTIRGLKYLLNSYKIFNEHPLLLINIVTSGSNYSEKYDEIQKFLNESDFIPDDIAVSTSLVDYGLKEIKYFLPQSKQERDYIGQISLPLFNWSDLKKQKSSDKQSYEDLFSQSEIEKDLYKIHKRLLTNNPIKQYGMNGCCVPGQRKLYITIDGDFYPCERVGKVPILGNVNTGYYIDKIKKIYVDDFIFEAKRYCKNCWAVNLCSLCYIDTCDENGVNFKYRHRACVSERLRIESTLVRYHSIFEHNPDHLDKFNKMVIH